MPYTIINDFAGGLDTRKSPLTSPPGTLQILKNAAVTPGGDIQKRRAFVQVADLTGTFGLAATESKLYAFTRDTAPPTLASGVPGISMVVQRIPVTSLTLDQADYDTFDGKVYLVCNDPAGATQALKNPHFYNAIETQGSGKGYYIRSYQSKIYAVLGKNLNFSAVDDPTNWTTGTGAGFINLSLQDADSELLTSLEVYYDQLSIFSSEATQLWAVDADPLQNTYNQLLRGTGTVAPRSTQQYGSGDVLLLANSGIRSLKARDASNAASVSDIGSPIDALIQELNLTFGSGYMSKAIALLEPVVGRFWMVFPDQIMVLSYFPSPKITAWSIYTLDFQVDQAVTCGGRIFLRSGDALYAYGGADGQAYENCGVEIRLPYLASDKPGHMKMYEAVDATVQGNWRIAVSYDFNNPDAEELVDNVLAPSWNQGRHELTGFASHYSLRFYNDDDQPARLSNIAVHYRMAQDED